MKLVLMAGLALSLLSLHAQAQVKFGSNKVENKFTWLSAQPFSPELAKQAMEKAFSEQVFFSQLKFIDETDVKKASDLNGTETITSTLYYFLTPEYKSVPELMVSFKQTAFICGPKATDCESYLQWHLNPQVGVYSTYSDLLTNKLNDPGIKISLKIARPAKNWSGVLVTEFKHLMLFNWLKNARSISRGAEPPTVHESLLFAKLLMMRAEKIIKGAIQ